MDARPAKAARTVQRTIHFFRIDAGLDENGRPVSYLPTPVLQHVNRLSFESGDRYWEHATGELTCSWIDGVDCLRLATVRRSNLPQLERGGRLSDLRIETDAGLAEQAHFVFFPGNILGVEFNFFGPRASRLPGYFSYCAREITQPFAVLPLIRGDMSQQLNQLSDIRLFTLRAHRSMANWVAEADESLGQAFASAAAIGEAQEIEISLRVRGRSRRTLGSGIAQVAMNIVQRLRGDADAVENISEFRVAGHHGTTGRLWRLDLLNEYILSSEEVATQVGRSRALVKESVYQAIRTAYQRSLPEIVEAVAISL